MPKFFNVLAAKDFSTLELPFTELKNTLLKEFAMSEYERVSQLLDHITLGEKRLGDLLSEMIPFSATTDDNIVKGLWLRRLSDKIAAELTTNDQPLDTLGATANAIYEMLNRNQQVTAQKVPAA